MIDVTEDRHGMCWQQAPRNAKRTQNTGLFVTLQYLSTLFFLFDLYMDGITKEGQRWNHDLISVDSSQMPFDLVPRP
jgi:hypothetical protein